MFSNIILSHLLVCLSLCLEEVCFLFKELCYLYLCTGTTVFGFLFGFGISLFWNANYCSSEEHSKSVALEMGKRKQNPKQ